MENAGIIKAEIKSILAMKAKEGATFQAIKDEYSYLMGKELCFNSVEEFNDFMRTIPDVWAAEGRNGLLVWRSNSNKSKHIAKMVQNQKSSKENKAPFKRRVFYSSTSTCYYNDNYSYKNKSRNWKSDSNLNENKPASKKNIFHSYELIGDDFFLNIENLDCKKKMEYIHTANGYKGRPIKKCGHCISGQSIKDVTNMLMHNRNIKLGNRIILNIGSVDLLHGRDFIKMREDFLALYAQFENRGIQPIITTLAPLANQCFSEDVQKKWYQFNWFLINNFPVIFDVAGCFLSNKQRVLFEYYQPLPKYVSGSNQPHCLWNYLGRQRVIKYLKQSLAETAYRNSIFQYND